jgi:hypothetical protein
MSDPKPPRQPFGHAKSAKPAAPKPRPKPMPAFDVVEDVADPGFEVANEPDFEVVDDTPKVAKLIPKKAMPAPGKKTKRVEEKSSDAETLEEDKPRPKVTASERKNKKKKLDSLSARLLAE